jgi:hypothetical protein
MWKYIGMVLVGVVVLLIGVGVLREFVGQGPITVLWIVTLIIAVVVVARNLMSNRKVSDATPEARTQALAFTPDSAHAALYVLRTQFLGKAVGVNVEIDGRAVAQLKSPRFTRILLTPGPHKISGYTGPASGRKPGGETDLNAAPGQIIVLLCEVVPGMVGTATSFKPVALESVRAKMHKTRMVAPDVASV